MGWPWPYWFERVSKVGTRVLSMGERTYVQHPHFLAMRGWTSSHEGFILARSKPKEHEYRAMCAETGMWTNGAFWLRTMRHTNKILRQSILGRTSGRYSLLDEWTNSRVRMVPTNGTTSFFKAQIPPLLTPAEANPPPPPPSAGFRFLQQVVAEWVRFLKIRKLSEVIFPKWGIFQKRAVA